MTETLIRTILPANQEFQQIISINTAKSCACKGKKINCLTAKEWIKNQLGVWQFFYEKRDIRDKKLHPATFPISLAKRIITLFSHEGELVLDPFVGSGTTLVAAQDTNRNAVGFDLLEKYVKLTATCVNRDNTYHDSRQIAVCDDALNIPYYFKPESVSLVWTSPPYANMLNRKRKNKSRRDRNNDQLDVVEQYSQNVRDLGTMGLDTYAKAIGDIFEHILPLLT